MQHLRITQNRCCSPICGRTSFLKIPRDRLHRFSTQNSDSWGLTTGCGSQTGDPQQRRCWERMGAIFAILHWKLSLNYASTSVGTGSFPYLWKSQRFMARALSSKSNSVAMKARKYPANRFTLISEHHWLQVILRGAAALTWITFILFCIASAISFGLCCADDGLNALAAKSLAHGYGYSLHFLADGYPPQFDGYPPQFNPNITTGPTLVLPCALMLRLFGDHEVIPGLVAIMAWAATFTFLFGRISRRVTNGSLFAGIAVFCLSISTVFAYFFENWHAVLERSRRRPS